MDGNQKVFKDILNQFDGKCVRFIVYFDKLITANLVNANIITRPASSNGLWCCFLIPLVMTIYTILYNVSHIYSLVTCISIGLLVYSLLFIVFLAVDCQVLNNKVCTGFIAPGLTSTLILYTFFNADLTLSLFISILAVIVYSILLRVALMKFPKTFTIGEAMIVVQIIVLYGTALVVRAATTLETDIDKELRFIDIIVNTVLSSVGLIVTALYCVSEDQRDLKCFGSIVVAAGFCALVALYTALGWDFLIQILNYLFMDSIRVRLITIWVSLTIIAVLVLLVKTQMNVKATTVARKTFHVLASVVFLSGIIFDVKLMTLATGIGFGILVLLEALRISKVEYISQILQSAFLAYSDEKDCGVLAMTPVYLYAGLACPLLLVPAHGGAPLELLGGVLATGVGDTAASWFGSRYGFNRWADGPKTLEGTTFNILCQVATVHALKLFDLISTRNSLVRTAVAATASALVEAKTDQVDNMIIPFITLLGFQSTFWLC